MKHEVAAVSLESRSKIKFNKFFKSFKTEEFAISLSFNSIFVSISINSISMKRFVQSKNYETFLISYKNWLHDKFSSIDIIAIEFYYQSCTKNVITCSKCDITLIDWKLKNNSMKKHNRYAICAWIEEQIVIASFISSLSSLFNQSELSLVASFELQTKFKSFKFEEFTISFNSKSTSIKSSFELIIKSDVAFVANSTFISVFISISNTKEFEAEKISDYIQKIMKQEIAVVVVAVIEAIKSEICVKDIDFFDSTMQMNFWKKFRISTFSASFLQHLIEIVVNYREKSVIKILSQCLRDSALQWLKNQFKFISLNDFKIVMTKIFFEFVVNFDSIIINSSSRFHISSTSRLLAHTQKNCFKSFTCKHCEKIFTSNNKLHMHVRVHHIKSDKTLRQYFVEEKSSHINLFNSFTSSITSRTMTASAKSSYLIISMTKAQVVCFITISVNSFITSKISREAIATNSKLITKSSRFSRSTLIISLILSITFKLMFASTRSSLLIISMTKTSVACFFTSSSNSFRTSILSHTTRKIYMTMKKLFEMFAEKTRRKSRSII